MPAAHDSSPWETAILPVALRPLAWTLVGMMAFCGLGCRQQVPVVAVTGTVRIDGQPAANVLVTFLPDPEKGTKGPRSAAATDAEGRYRLRSDEQRDGAVPGWHRVIVEDLAQYAMRREEKTPRPAGPFRSRVPAAYHDPRQTPLCVEVRQDAPTHDLDLATTPIRKP
jgi:hypothetical protein